jgi:hypothetical protein
MRRLAVNQAEQADEMEARQAGRARHLVERDRLVVATGDEVGGEQEAAQQLHAGRRLDAVDALCPLAQRPLFGTGITNQGDTLRTFVGIRSGRRATLGDRQQAAAGGTVARAQVIGEGELGGPGGGARQDGIARVGRVARVGHLAGERGPHVVGRDHDHQHPGAPVGIEPDRAGLAAVEHQPAVLVEADLSIAPAQARRALQHRAEHQRRRRRCRRSRCRGLT